MDEEFIEELILEGSVEPSGMSESGDFLYSFTKKIEELRPEIYEAMIEYQRLEVMALWELGFLSMDPTEYNPTIKVTDKATIEEERQALPEQLQLALGHILEAMRIK